MRKLLGLLLLVLPMFVTAQETIYVDRQPVIVDASPVPELVITGQEIIYKGIRYDIYRREATLMSDIYTVVEHATGDRYKLYIADGQLVKKVYIQPTVVYISRPAPIIYHSSYGHWHPAHPMYHPGPHNGFHPGPHPGHVVHDKAPAHKPQVRHPAPHQVAPNRKPAPTPRNGGRR